ncbi:MAG: helix-turn-helix domain-containing protein [Clostridiales bacterium]|nr:helix-turn-helix domain-containing protein [Clostridiales bacterium]
MNKLYKAKELAKILGCHTQTIYRMADRGQIESVKVGNMRRFLMPKGEEQNNAKSGRHS